jgi:hypothetical protein
MKYVNNRSRRKSKGEKKDDNTLLLHAKEKKV